MNRAGKPVGKCSGVAPSGARCAGGVYDDRERVDGGDEEIVPDERKPARRMTRRCVANALNHLGCTGSGIDDLEPPWAVTGQEIRWNRKPSFLRNIYASRT